MNLLLNSTQRKHIFRWLESLEKDYFLKKKQPWLVFDAIDFLNSLPIEGKKVFEYGSGGSTLFWLKHGAECISIEHNPDWYKLMHSHLWRMNNIEYRLVLPEPEQNKEAQDITDPNLYLSEDELTRGFNFRSYVGQIDSFPDNYFDIVLIDGRARPSCILHSVTKVKVGGILVLDNSDRAYYLNKTTILLQNYDRKIFKGATPNLFWFTETSVFTRKM